DCKSDRYYAFCFAVSLQNFIVATFDLIIFARKKCPGFLRVIFGSASIELTAYCDECRGEKSSQLQESLHFLSPSFLASLFSESSSSDFVSFFSVFFEFSMTFSFPLASISTFFLVTSCSTILNSTRRFFSRPSSVSLSAIGFSSPKPLAVSLSSLTPCSTK